jgi:methyl-accepting chemotaxis protein-1 (serine sensor receptor)
MNSLKISTRLGLLIGSLALLLTLIGGIGLYGIASSNDSLTTVYQDRTVALGQIADIQRRMLGNQLAVFNAAGQGNATGAVRYIAEVEANIAAIDKTWVLYMATVLTPAEAGLAKAFAVDRARFAQEGLQPALAALRAGDRAEAGRLMAEVIEPLFAPAAKGLQGMAELQIDVARSESLAAAARYQAIRAVEIGATAAGLIAAVLFGVAMARSISGQLGAEPHELAAITGAIAQGDLTSNIVPRAGAERSVMAGMAGMQASLRKVVGTVRTSSDSIATGSTQIAAGNADLSQRTEEQAANLQQTAASMEQLTSTVKNTADTAHQATQLAGSASAAAAQGGVVVGQVVATMEAITASSSKIADIIGVIDGIAFQTNILALNAAVEAARAGEQGRGFAVVASEVRNLARRSAEAAKEIKGLITESVSNVQAGSRQVGEAGRTMSDIVAQVKRVSGLIGEISAAAREQTQGISQVGDAVNQLDQVTQQNAALVEESAAAADSLSQQAARLVDAVSLFTLGGKAAARVV